MGLHAERDAWNELNSLPIAEQARLTDVIVSTDGNPKASELLKKLRSASNADNPDMDDDEQRSLV